MPTNNHERETSSAIGESFKINSISPRAYLRGADCQEDKENRQEIRPLEELLLHLHPDHEQTAQDTPSYTGTTQQTI